MRLIELIRDNPSNPWLFHGTSILNAMSIFHQNMMIGYGGDGHHSGVSFSTEYDVAASFASDVEEREQYSDPEFKVGQSRGAIIAIRQSDLEKKSALVDVRWDGADAEHELRSKGDIYGIREIAQFVIHPEDIQIYVRELTQAAGEASYPSVEKLQIFASIAKSQLSETITERRIQNTEIMYHGTTDKHLRSIIKQGLLANPPKRTYSGEDDMEAGYETFGGVYLANNKRKALAAAMDAVSKFGGNAILVIVQYVQGSGNMDEDMFTNVISQDVYNAMIAYEEQVEDNPESSEWDTYHEYSYYNRDQAVNDLVASATEHFERYGRFGEAFLPNLRAAFEYVLYHVDDDMITGSSRSLMTSLRDHPEFIKIIENLMRNLFPTGNREAQDLAVQITRNIGFRGKTKIVRIETTRGEVLWENPAAPTVGDY